MVKRQKPGWRVRVGLAWIAAVLLAYYLIHPPFSGDFFAQVFAPAHHLVVDVQVLLRFGSHVLYLLLTCWLVLVAAAVGQFLWGKAALPAGAGTLRVALGTGLGLGVLSLASFALGMLGWLSAWVLWIGLALLSLLCWRQGWWVLGWAGGQVRQIPDTFRKGAWLERCLWGFVLATLALLVLVALLPPTAWDALMYHLAAPARDLAQGRVLPDVSNVQGYQPQLVEMLSLDGLLLYGDGVAALLQVGFGLLSVLTLVALVSQMTSSAQQMADASPMPDAIYNRALALRAVALFLSIPSLVLVLGWPYVDGALVYYELAALCALLCWWNARGTLRLSWLALTGMLAGLALDVKYTGVFALVALALLVAWRSWRVLNFPRMLWQVACFGAIALLVGSPWLLRNLFLTGDPIFPYHLGHLFPAGPLWDDGRTQHAVEGPGWGWGQAWRLLALPLEVTIFGRQGSVEFDATLGPLLLLLLPLGLLLCSGRSPGAFERGGVRERGGEDAHAGQATEGQGETQQRYTEEHKQGTLRSGVVLAEVKPMPDGASWTERQAVGVLLAFATVEGLCWGVELLSVHFAEQSRLFFPLFAALTVPAAVVWLRLKAPSSPVVERPVLYRLATGAVILALGCGVLAQMGNTLGNGNAPYLLGMQSREAYLADHLDPYYAAMRAVNALSPSAHVLFFWEVRSYYTTRVVNSDPFLDNFDYYYRHCPTPEQMMLCLKHAGFTHVLLYAQGVQLILEGRPGDLSTQEWTALEWMLAQFSAPLYADTAPLLIDSSQHVSPAVEQALGRQSWYRLYALSGG
jgi:hypothetical protein